MINLRYHIVSITAVFLALGIGVAMGSSFLSDAAIDQVNRNIQSTRQEARDAREEAARLDEQVDRDDERAAALREQGAERVFRDSLEGVPVVVLTVGGIDEDSLDLLRTALDSSRADFEGTLTITDDVVAAGDAADAVRALLGADEDVTEAGLRARLVAAVADELAGAAEAPEDEGDEGTGGTTATTTSTTTTAPGQTTTTTLPDGTTTTTLPPEDPFQPTLLRGLVEAGVFDYEPAPGGVPIEEALERPGHRFVIVSGAGADVADAVFFQPLLRALTDDGPAPVVVASAAVGEDAEATRAAVVQPLLDDEQMGARITTVDHLETFSGIAAVVLGLDDLGRDRRGHYGLGAGAESQLPLP